MGQQLEIYKKRKAALTRLATLVRHPQHVLIIHYSCESFYDRADGRTPRITSIAVRNFGSGQTESFSIHKIAELKGISAIDIVNNYDPLEKEMLGEFFEFVLRHSNFTWVHWNMRNINFGFQAIEHRYSVLGGTPIKVDESRKFDLSRELVAIYGDNYISHPRIEKLVEKNEFTSRNFMAGAAEAQAFDDGEYVKLHQSTLRKVDIFTHFAAMAADNTLRTDARWRDRYGIHPSIVIELVKEHWLYSLLGGIALILALARGWTFFT